ncbi:RluA family pseudouridine synthase [Pseudoalteromonas sp. MMG010]|uniref:RluA family pseudouridine synthase n=1 Tax=Pseudoalteromonas sp. MMG010 TaxID=2822685 RepID=UPI001B3A4AAD|nr:RluA family pseudouridine synthase [Pseudoalteromonas sp. MMG010]MBQ4833246.1 RluA family pseudouridine synthase [Pseudoalteromonas sp. MMG010]
MDHFIAPKCRQVFDILYQDDDILLINKPSGLLSLSGKNPLNWDSVHYRLVNGQADRTPAFVNAKLVHRLDFGTSGIMIVSLNDAASKHLNQQFQQRTIKKRYIAMLDGELSKESGQICAAIAKGKDIFPRVKICELTGKPAATDYKVLERYNSPTRTKVEFSPTTGRTHQLRVHSLFINHPILGCDLYKNEHSEALAERLQLHASYLGFKHPTTNLPMTIHCESNF